MGCNVVPNWIGLYFWILWKLTPFFACAHWHFIKAACLYARPTCRWTLQLFYISFSHIMFLISSVIDTRLMVLFEPHLCITLIMYHGIWVCNYNLLINGEGKLWCSLQSTLGPCNAWQHKVGWALTEKGIMHFALDLKSLTWEMLMNWLLLKSRGQGLVKKVRIECVPPWGRG